MREHRRYATELLEFYLSNFPLSEGDQADRSFDLASLYRSSGCFPPRVMTDGNVAASGGGEGFIHPLLFSFAQGQLKEDSSAYFQCAAGLLEC